jgi:hypothetical protein
MTDQDPKIPKTYRSEFRIHNTTEKTGRCGKYFDTKYYLTLIKRKTSERTRINKKRLAESFETESENPDKKEKQQRLWLRTLIKKDKKGRPGVTSDAENPGKKTDATEAENTDKKGRPRESFET